MIEHSDLTTKVYQWLKERILHHAFLPGEKLDVQQLADDLGVSRTPVKDAINRLASEGLVVLQSRRGTYVATLTPETLRDLFDLRMMTESWAVQHLTPDAMATVANEVQEMFDRSARIIIGSDAAHFDYSAFYALDMQMHARIVGLSGNAELLDLHHLVTARLSVGRIYFPGEDEVFIRSLAAHQEHAAIVGAFVNGDAPALLAAVRAHIEASMRHTEWLLDRFVQMNGSFRDLPATSRAVAAVGTHK